MLRKLLILLVTLNATVSLAIAGDAAPDPTLVPQYARPLIKGVDDRDLTEAQRRGWAAGEETLRNIQGGSKLNPDDVARNVALMRPGQTRGLAIMQSTFDNHPDRAALLRFMGKEDPNKETKLYIFVSTSMPPSLLRAYIFDAAWANGTLVFRGIPKGMKIGAFLKKYIFPVMKSNSGLAPIVLDPRLWTQYKVSAAPSIVYSEVTPADEIFACDASQGKSAKPWGGAFADCGPYPENKYWKVAGSVSAAWALEHIRDNGGRGAERHLQSMRNSGLAMGKAQVPRSLDYPPITPKETEAVNATLRSLGLKAVDLNGVTAFTPLSTQIPAQSKQPQGKQPKK